MSRTDLAPYRFDRRLLSLVVVGLLGVLVGGGVGLQAWRTHRAPSGLPSGPSQDLAPAVVEPGKPISFGPEGAPNTVTLYEDFHCPHCADFEEDLGPVLREAYQSGAARLEVYPMAFVDDGSTAAANAMACAAEHGFGESYHRGLFANSALKWSSEQLIALAGKVSRHVPPGFQTCVTSGAHLDWVQSVNAAASAAGVTRTPAMFFNGDAVELTDLTPAALDARTREGAR